MNVSGRSTERKSAPSDRLKRNSSRAVEAVQAIKRILRNVRIVPYRPYFLVLFRFATFPFGEKLTALRNRVPDEIPT